MKKMVIVILTVVCALILFGCAIFKKPTDDPNGDPIDNIINKIENIGYGGDPIEFQSFKISERGMSAEAYVYEGWKTETGAHLEYYTEISMWDDEAGDYVDTKNIIRAIDGGEDFYKELCSLFGNCRIDKWEGFDGPNPPGVLDGSSMGFEAVLGDGKRISAHGSNNFPGNYGTFTGALHDIATLQKITSTNFTDGYYEVTLPESWIGVVTARFSEGLVAFTVTQNDGSDLTFFIIDNDWYGYSSDTYDGRVEIGRLIKGDDVRFITARDHYAINNYSEKVSAEALKIWETYADDKDSVIESLKGVNGYELYPEDGSVLYESDARNMASEARSLWLYLNFAGEYSGGVEPTRIDGRDYKPMFPSYEFTNTVEKVRERFLKVFSEEFTDRIINEAMARKDLIEYDGDVYVAYKKNKGETAYNYWVDSVRDGGDGKFFVVMATRRESVEGEIYIDFPAERNADGKFVFTDYPYWDESE